MSSCSDPDDLPLATQREIDRRCLEFEDAWQLGQSPAIERFLVNQGEPGLAVLFRELLRIDIDFRRTAGEQPVAADYTSRFPAHTELIANVFREEASANEDHSVPLSPENIGEPADGGELPTLESFLESLGRSGLMLSTEVQAILDTMPPDSRPSTALALAQGLLQRGKLTPFQAQALLGGNAKRLLLGNYVVLEKLGQGGMGQVLKAQHLKMKRLVAVKTIAPAAMKSPAAVKRFYREMETAARLSHPNIVQAHDADEHEGVHYLVMEYVDGKDLAAIINQNGPLSVPEAVECIVQAGRGLQYAHDQGVVHRDIKPANLLLDKKGVVKILDMGLARIGEPLGDGDGERLTESGQILGTLDYMAPEQALDIRRVGPRADIYSLGCTLYWLLTGQTPYQGETSLQILLAHRESPIPSLRRARPGIPACLDAVFRKMVAKRPEGRYSSIAEVLADLDRCMGNRDGVMEALAECCKTACSHEASACQKAKPVAVSAHDPNMPGLGGENSIVAPSRYDNESVDRWWKRATAVALVLAGIAAITLFALSGRPGREEVGTSQLLESTATQPASSPIPNPPPPAIAPFDAQKAREHQEAWAKYLGVSVETTNSIGMKLVLIPPGEFDMGSTPEVIAAEQEIANRDEKSRPYSDRVLAESPRHRVRITKPFCFGLYPVTQAEYERVMGVNPSSFTHQRMDASRFNPPLSAEEIRNRQQSDTKYVGNDSTWHPVECVAWGEALEFCRRLSAMPAELAARRAYRLPTEAEWEYACRAGTTTRWYSGDDESAMASVAGDSWQGTMPVGRKLPNPWGLHDLYGNVFQWCSDWFNASYYKKSPPNDPTGPQEGSLRVARGGWWTYTPSSCRSATRSFFAPGSRTSGRGFRVVAEIASEPNVNAG
jgi:formylglycine-generating enzyme required for sulfatase activity